MNIALWIVQGVLAVFYTAAGVMKVIRPRSKLEDLMSWVEEFSMPAVRSIGAVELAAAVGLIVPAVTGIVPALTGVAAAALTVHMLLAVALHIRRREPDAIAFAALLAIAAAFVAWGRLGPHSL